MVMILSWVSVNLRVGVLDIYTKTDTCFIFYVLFSNCHGSFMIPCAKKRLSFPSISTQIPLKSQVLPISLERRNKNKKVLNPVSMGGGARHETDLLKYFNFYDSIGPKVLNG